MDNRKKMVFLAVITDKGNTYLIYFNNGIFEKKFIEKNAENVFSKITSMLSLGKNTKDLESKINLKKKSFENDTCIL